MDFYEAYRRGDRPGAAGKPRRKHAQRQAAREHDQHFGDFTCRHCQRRVTADPERSRVQHRNHCPYCLWSKHVDWRAAGDRLAACKAPMQPVGLAFKQGRKQYAAAQPGELMVVHQCVGCGALSLNRIAADDGLPLLWDVFEASLAQPPAWVAGAQAAGIELLGAAARDQARAAVFGRGG